MLASINLANLTTSQGIKINGATANDYSGFSVNTVGDVNNDGYTDIVIGAPLADPNSRTDAGISYVIYGGTTSANIDLLSLTSTQGIKINGAEAYDNSGYSVSAAGDVNNDTYPDIIIGAYNADPNFRTNAGISYVIYGGAISANIDLLNLTSMQGFMIYGSASGDNSGYSVSAAGDVNNDGFPDVIIGAPLSTRDNFQIGTSYVIYGSITPTNIDLANLDLTQGFKIYGDTTDSTKSGISVGAAGDFNKDGYDDVVIGALLYKGYDEGASYLIYGSAAPKNIELLSLSATQGFTLDFASDCSGNSVNTAGDFNGDGYSDIIIGSSYKDKYWGGGCPGFSKVIYGNAVGINQGFQIAGYHALYGDVSVSTAGDVNNDGYSDIIIGARSLDFYSGISYVIYGNASPTNIDLQYLSATQGFIIYGVTGYSNPHSVSTAGDINNDGYNDIILGAYASSPNSRSSAGASYVIYGSESGFITDNPTKFPTIIPSTIPSTVPTYTPTDIPSFLPTVNPTSDPSSIPTSTPSAVPTAIPTLISTVCPTEIPTSLPTDITASPTVRAPSIDDNTLHSQVTNQFSRNDLFKKAQDSFVYYNNSTNQKSIIKSKNVSNHHIVRNNFSVKEIEEYIKNKIKESKLAREKIFEEIKNTTKKHPIGISLTEEEIEIIPYRNSKVTFDYNENNNPLKTSWVGAKDAILVYDHNSNKKVDFAKEIVLTEWCFEAKTDFEALLCSFDTDKNKIFNHQDQEFANFFLWQDKNQDGISQDGELTTLEEAGILAIDFRDYKEIQGELRDLGALNIAEVFWEDGRVTGAYDLVFTHDIYSGAG